MLQYKPPVIEHFLDLGHPETKPFNFILHAMWLKQTVIHLHLLVAPALDHWIQNLYGSKVREENFTVNYIH